MTYQMGQKLGNYRLVRLLGAGGFAEVYLGKHIYLHTLAAIKVLQIQMTDEAVQKFLKEARIIANLEHPNIVRVLEFAIEKNHKPYLVMHYAQHGTLRQLYPRHQQLSPATILPHLKQIASALQYAHTHKIIHRDVKPENMLLDAQNNVLLSDFGLALEAHSSHHRKPMDQAGTTSYMAPEQFKGQPCAASDQYALGIVLYEWLTGTLPFKGTNLVVAVKHTREEPQPLTEHVPALPAEINTVVLKALKKDPQERYQHVQDFVDAFEEACLHSQLPIYASPAIALKTMAVEQELSSARDLPLHSASTLFFQQTQSAAWQTIPMPDSASGELSSSLQSLWESTILPVQPVTSSALQQDKPETVDEVADAAIVPQSSIAKRSLSRRSVLYGMGGLGLLCLGGFLELQHLNGKDRLQTAPQMANSLISSASKTNTRGTSQSTGRNRNTVTSNTGGTNHQGGQQPSQTLQTTDTTPSSTSNDHRKVVNKETPPYTKTTPGTTTPTPESSSSPTPAPTSGSLSSTSTPSPTPEATSGPGVIENGPLTITIGTMPETVNNQSTVTVPIQTSAGNISYRLHVTYSSTIRMFRSGVQKTDSSGNGSVSWPVNAPTAGGDPTMATLIATARDELGNLTVSNIVQVQVV